jgi:hypothetical protein
MGRSTAIRILSYLRIGKYIYLLECSRALITCRKLYQAPVGGQENRRRRVVSGEDVTKTETKGKNSYLEVPKRMVKSMW